MRKLPALPDLLPYYRAVIQQLQSEKALSIDQGLDLAATLYREVRIGDAEPGGTHDEDMRLSYNSWSTLLPVLAEWLNVQKATPGFTLAQANAFRDVNLVMRQV